MNSIVRSISPDSNDLVLEFDTDLFGPEDDEMLMDNDTHQYLMDEIAKDPALQRTFDDIVASPNDVMLSSTIEQPKGPPTRTVRIVDLETMHNPLQPIPTSPTPSVQEIRIKQKPTHTPTFIEVRVFTRQEDPAYAISNFLGMFMIPYLTGCLQHAQTYHSMIVKAGEFIRRQRPYNKIQQFFDFAFVKPSFTFASEPNIQFTVNHTNIPALVNPNIPEPTINLADHIILIMTVTVDLVPKFAIAQVSYKANNQTKQNTNDENSHKKAYAQTAQPHKLQVTDRLGPAVERPFVTPAPDGLAHLVINGSPIPSTSNPQSACHAPKGKSRSKPSTSILKNKGKSILKPRSLFN
jgi:hypothetical protein